jgi:hypothetical protein
MKILFKITVLMLITSNVVKAQTHDIFKKSFDATNLKTLALDFNSSYVEIVESEDNKIYFDYTIEFKNYSKKEIEEVLEKIETSAEVVGDKLQFKANSENTLGDVVYSLETLYGITFEGDYINFKEKTDRQFRQSKQYFLDINSSSRGKSIKEYLKNIREVDEKGNKKKFNSKNVKVLKTNFIIKMPSHLKIRVMATNSNMGFKLDLENQLNVNARNTSLKFKDLNNPLNNLDIVNGSFRSNTLTGGSYKFTHVDNVQIAEVKNLTIDSEFTTIKIGEIGKNVEIIDFNSKFWLHNFSKDFTDFTMNTEYSEINMFYPEDIDYYIETYGHDAVIYWNNVKTEITPSRKNKPSKMMIIGKETSPNKIQINTVHSIIRFGEDFIDFGE